MPELIWKGKEQVVNHHLDVPVRTLEHRYDFNCPKGSESGNKIIHGDNLAALKALLPQYEGKVKCIYIDPPYKWQGAVSFGSFLSGKQRKEHHRVNF